MFATTSMRMKLRLTMKVGDLVRVSYRGLGILVFLGDATARIELFSGKRVVAHPSNLELISESR